MATMNIANNCYFTKTQRGREEIATRKYGLTSKLRWLLVLVDGKSSKEELLNKASVLGIDESVLAELVNSDFVTQVDSDDVDSPKPSTAPTQPTERGAVVIAISDAKDAAQEEASPATDIAQEHACDSVEQILALKTFFNETIKNTLGLRGFAMQLKVERASTLQDFIDLRQPYIEAVNKARGKEMACSLRERLDQHLGLANPKKPGP